MEEDMVTYNQRQLGGEEGGGRSKEGWRSREE